MLAKWMTSKKVTKINIRKIAAAFFVFFLSVDSAIAAVFDVIYIEAGEGNSSGGHLAIQLGENIFHYQYDNGMIRLFKNNTDAFREDYQNRQNRSMHVAEVAISEETLELLKNHFNLRFFSQNQQIKLIESLRQDQFLLQALLDHKPLNQNTSPSVKNEDSLPLAGAGLFFSNGELEAPKPSTECDAAHASARISTDLKQQISIKYGDHFLLKKINDLRDEINDLSPTPNNLTVASYQYSFSEQYSDLLTGFLALNALQDNQPLAINTCFQVNDPKLRLNEEEIKKAELFQNKLLQTAQSLIMSKRPDWGYALFVTLARLTVLDHSIQNRQWTFLVDDESGAKAIPKEQIKLYADLMENRRRSDLEHLYQKTNQMNFNLDDYEQHYVDLELAANRVHHWIESDVTGRLKYRSEQPLPLHNLPSTRFLMSNLTVDQLKLALNSRKSAEKRLLEKDIESNAYNLLTKNCVSMLIKHINEAVAGQSKEKLGGYIDPEINFVPFQTFDTVESTYNVVNTTHLPAFRQQQLTKLYSRENEGLVFLRESNIFSSSLYNYNSDDAWFVFFTDDDVLPRPLFGAFNILAAASQSLFGLFNWPFDGGKDIKVGLKGVLASLPELAFFNIRKGSYPYKIEGIN